MKIKINDIEQEVTDEQLAAIREIVPGAFPAEDEPLVYVPKVDEAYEWLAGDGDVVSSYWHRSELDLARLAIGNVFRVGRGEKAAAKRRAETACRRWASENGWFKPKDGERGWRVVKDERGQLTVVRSGWQYSPDPIKFRTELEAKRFLAECEEHLKVWWGMEDAE